MGNIKITNRGMGWDSPNTTQLNEAPKIKTERTHNKYNRRTLTILITKQTIKK